MFANLLKKNINLFLYIYLANQSLQRLKQLLYSNVFLKASKKINIANIYFIGILTPKIYTALLQYTQQF